jgi:hypothetical protein
VPFAFACITFCLAGGLTDGLSIVPHFFQGTPGLPVSERRLKFTLPSGERRPEGPERVERPAPDAFASEPPALTGGQKQNFSFGGRVKSNPKTNSRVSNLKYPGELFTLAPSTLVR